MPSSHWGGTDKEDRECVTDRAERNREEDRREGGERGWKGAKGVKEG